MFTFKKFVSALITIVGVGYLAHVAVNYLKKNS